MKLNPKLKKKESDGENCGQIKNRCLHDASQKIIKLGKLINLLDYGQKGRFQPEGESMTASISPNGVMANKTELGKLRNWQLNLQGKCSY